MECVCPGLMEDKEQDVWVCDVHVFSPQQKTQIYTKQVKLHSKTEL